MLTFTSDSFMKGVAYQADVSTQKSTVAGQSYHDPLADATACKRDVPYLQELGTNTIRVYAIDPTKNHDECMKLLDAAGRLNYFRVNGRLLTHIRYICYQRFVGT